MGPKKTATVVPGVPGVRGCGRHGCVLDGAAVTPAEGSAGAVYRLQADRIKRCEVADMPAFWTGLLARRPGLAVKHMQARSAVVSAFVDRAKEFDEEVAAVHRLATHTDAGFIKRFTTVPLPDGIVGVVMADGATSDGYSGELHLVLQTLCPDTVLALARRGPRGALPKAELKRMVTDVLEAVERLQKHDLLHSDIKADNIVLCGDRYKLIDWGSMQEAAGARRPTASNHSNNPLSHAVTDWAPVTAFYALDFNVKRLQVSRGVRPARRTAANAAYTEWLDDLTELVFVLTKHVVRDAAGDPERIMRENAGKFDLFSVGVAVLQAMDKEAPPDAELTRLVERLMLPHPAFCDRMGWRDAAEGRAALVSGNPKRTAKKKSAH